MLRTLQQRAWIIGALSGGITVLLASGALADLRLPQPDERLETKVVTLDVEHSMLMDALNELSEQSGVVISAGTSERDWRVRERRVSVKATDIPLSDLLSQIILLLDYSISQTGTEGDYSYVIWQDRNARALEAELIAAQQAEKAERAMKMRKAAFDSAKEALALTEAQAYVQRETDPWLAFLGGTKSGRGYSTLLQYIYNNFPTERELILRGQNVTISLDNLPPEIYQAVQGIDSLIMDSIFSDDDNAEIQDVLKSVVPRLITFESLENVGEAFTDIMGVPGMVEIKGSLQMGWDEFEEFPADEADFPLGFFPFAGADSIMGKFFGEFYLALYDGSNLGDAFDDTDDLAEFELYLASLERPSPTEDNPPTDPLLTREVELKEVDKKSLDTMFEAKGSHEDIGKDLQLLSDTLGIPVLLESFNFLTPVSPFLTSGKQPVYQILIGIEKAGYIWEMDDTALRIRPDDWALRRSYDVAQSVINRYLSIIQRQDSFTLDDFANLVTELTEKQIQHNIAPHPELGSFVYFTTYDTAANDALRFYGALTTGQKQALHTDQGLHFSQINDAQWEHLASVISLKLGGVEVADCNVMIMPRPVYEDTERSDIDWVTFEIYLYLVGEDQPRTINETVIIPSREYIERFRTINDNQEDAESED